MPFSETRRAVSLPKALGTDIQKQRCRMTPAYAGLAAHEHRRKGKTMRRPKVILASIFVLMIAASAQARIIRVPGDYGTIQAGIDAAISGDTVLVANGTYKGIGNKDLDLKGKAITVTSENGAEATVIDCEGMGQGFIFRSGETLRSVVSGFTIRNGSTGKNLVQIALNPQTGEKMVFADVRKDTNRPMNDGDIAVEPDEIAMLQIALRNNSVSPISSITATLKTADKRVKGLTPVYTGVQITSWNEVDMAGIGIPVACGTIYGNSTKSSYFQFVKIDRNFTPLGDVAKFTLEVRSGTSLVGKDEFNVKVGADIVMDRVKVDDDLKPGGDAEDIDVRVRNITSNSIKNVRVQIDPDSRAVTVDEDRVEFTEILAGRTKEASFGTQIKAGFSGSVQFKLNIEVDRKVVNIEYFTYHFGMRSQYIAHWIDDDDNNNGIAEPGEQIDLRVARWNPTDQEAEYVKAMLSTSDNVITGVTQDTGEYGDIEAYEAEEARRGYEFTVAGADAFAGKPDFETLGYTMSFTLSVEEDRESMGDETFAVRIGGMVRYLRPGSYEDLMATISDDKDLGSNNNGNGVPEPGEVIAMAVTLINVWNNDIEDIEAELDARDGAHFVVDYRSYGTIKRRGRQETREYIFSIDTDFTGGRIAFELKIKGRVDGKRKNLGTDVFTIPVGRISEESTIAYSQVGGTSESVTNTAAFYGYGGAILCIGSSPTIERNIIKGNSATLDGGGIYYGNNSYPTIVNNLIVGNSAGVNGGGICGSDTSSATMVNNTISGNKAGTDGGGIRCQNGSFATVLNTILWANTPNELSFGPRSGVNITYSDIRDAWPGDGNINADPRFLNVAKDDYSLMDDSPCINTGTTTQNVPSKDVKGNSRPNPAGSKPDMGAYESHLPVLAVLTVTGVAPSSLSQGSTGKDITITGTNFLSGATVSFSGTGITVRSTDFVSSTKLMVRIDVSTDAAVGDRDVIVTNPDNQTFAGKAMLKVTSAEARIVRIEVKEPVVKGLSFPVAVTVEGATNLAGFQFGISFNPAILEVVKVEEGTLLPDVGTTYWLEPKIDNANGTITGIVSVRTGEGGAAGSGTLATITFKAIGTGAGYIKLQNVVLSNSKGQSVPVTPLDGSVTVVEPPAESPPWDVNRDGKVDVLDMVLVADNLGKDITTPVVPNPDVNGDGKVNVFDFVIVAQYFGAVYSAAAPSRDIWSVDPRYLPMLARMYNMVQDRSDSDPAFLSTKELLRRLISSIKVSRTEAFQNYPNPFNPETWIPFQLAEGSDVEVRIYNSAGRLVKVLDLGFRDAGYYTSREDSARWDGTDESGERAASGVYFYTVRAGEYTATRKMLLVK